MRVFRAFHLSQQFEANQKSLLFSLIPLSSFIFLLQSPLRAVGGMLHDLCSRYSNEYSGILGGLLVQWFHGELLIF